eukprot:1500598-Rhodomonas_salina.1
MVLHPCRMPRYLPTPCSVLTSAICLGARYAMSGTEIAYAATRRPRKRLSHAKALRLTDPSLLSCGLALFLFNCL